MEKTFAASLPPGNLTVQTCEMLSYNAELFQLLSKGLFAVNKIKNLTSVQVLEKLKLILTNDVKPKYRPRHLKLGHGGTLDATATGVLVVGVGWGCKVLPRLLAGSKKYIVTGCLGTATDTYNETGTVVVQQPYDHISQEMLEKALPIFQGHILQTPPKFSALKLHGTRIADWTRAGVEIDMKPRPVVCHSIQCVEFSPPHFKLEVTCGGGFYVRSLVHDLGLALHSCAHVAALRRTQHGPFAEEDMLEPCHWTVEHIARAISRARERHGSELQRPHKAL